MKQTKVQEPKANKKNKNSSKISNLHGLCIYKHHIKIVAHPYVWFAI